MKSLRNTVMLYVTILLVGVGIAAAATSYVFVKREVNSFQDNALEQVAMTAGMTYRNDIEPNVNPELEDQLVVQIWSHAGEPIHHSGPQADIPFQTELGYFNVEAGGERWRVFRARDSQYSLQVSQRWSAREEVAEDAAAGAALPLVAAIPVAWLLIGWAVNRVLRGLGTLSTELATRSTDATGPLAVDNLPTEVAPVVTAMNSLIQRLQAVLEKQRRFIADAAHELRTPLAALQIQADNLAHREGAASTGSPVRNMQQGVRRASSLVNQLLVLARTDTRARDEPHRIELTSALRTVIADFVTLAEAKDISLVLDAPSEIEVTTRDADLSLVLSTLLENAVAYSAGDSPSDITVAARRTGSRALIEITDNGCGIAETALPKVFDRFFRAAPPGCEGTGLGLSIARAAADRNGMTLSIRNRSDVRGVIASVGIAAM